MATTANVHEKASGSGRASLREGDDVKSQGLEVSRLQS
jgi:hypothetical protein